MVGLRNCLLVSLPLYHYLILLLVLISSFYHASHLVFADDNLIKQQCHNADVPTVCIRCLKSDPRGESADKIGIATILITCLSNQSQILANNMSSLALNVQDKNSNTVFQGCKERFLQGVRDLANATSQLKSGNYDETNSCVRTALEEEIACERIVAAGKSRLPSNVVYQMRVFQELSDATMRIVDRF